MAGNEPREDALWSGNPAFRGQKSRRSEDRLAGEKSGLLRPALTATVGGRPLLAEMRVDEKGFTEGTAGAGVVDRGAGAAHALSAFLRDPRLPDRERRGRDCHRTCRPAADETCGDAAGAAGADAMLALRSVHRSTGAWDTFWRARAA